MLSTFMKKFFKKTVPVGFSERYGLKKLKSVIQVDSMDSDLKTSLWNALCLCYWNSVVDSGGRFRTIRRLSFFGNESLRELCHALWLNFYKRPITSLPDDWQSVLSEIYHAYTESEWNEVYDFIQFTANYFPIEEVNNEFIQMCNFYLEREVSAYRFINKTVTQITTDEEMLAIEEALHVKIDPVRKHLDRALELFSDRKSPDYRNSIKESISAVEAMVKSVAGGAKGTLGQLLNQLERVTTMHPAIKTAFSSLYGYTSDANGIRHALIDKDTISFEEAKFMLVACSAFVNYVTGILNK